MILEEILTTIPFTAEQLILILRISGAVSGILAILFLFHTISLNNSLSIEKAQFFILQNTMDMPVLTEQSMPKLELNPKVEKTEKPKRPLLTTTISDNAQELLGKLALSVSYEDGWQGAPVRN